MKAKGWTLMVYPDPRQADKFDRFGRMTAIYPDMPLEAFKEQATSTLGAKEAGEIERLAAIAVANDPGLTVVFASAVIKESRSRNLTVEDVCSLCDEAGWAEWKGSEEFASVVKDKKKATLEGMSLPEFYALRA
jgi:hypothetical protein